MARVRAVALDVNDLPRMEAFWSAVLEVEAVDRDEDGVSLPLTGDLTLDLLRVPEPKAVKDRLHLDLSPGPDADQGAELARLLSIGATRTEQGPGPQPPADGRVVLADPDGNRFCLLPGPG